MGGSGIGEVFRNRCSAVLGLPADIWSLWPEYLRMVQLWSAIHRSPVIAWHVAALGNHGSADAKVLTQQRGAARRAQKWSCGRQLRVSLNAGPQNPTFPYISSIYNGKKYHFQDCRTGLYHAFLCNSKRLGGRPRPALGMQLIVMIKPTDPTGRSFLQPRKSPKPRLQYMSTQTFAACNQPISHWLVWYIWLQSTRNRQNKLLALPAELVALHDFQNLM